MSPNKKKEKKKRQKKQPPEVTAKYLENLKRVSADDPGLVEFATSLGSGKVAPLEESAIRAQSHRAMNDQLNIQMEQIVEQIRLLAKQVEDLRERKKISEEIYLAKMTFEPVIGKIYYLYFNPKEKRNTLSMISPEEWGNSVKELEYLAKVTLLGDRTWKVEENSNNN